MLRPCDRCDNQATVHLTEIDKGGGKTERHLCENCARSLHVPQAASKELQKLLKTFEPVHALTSTLTGLSRSCPECGMTFSEFRQHGRFGCAKDYEVFGQEVSRLLRRIHGADTYTGKAPRGGEVREGELIDELTHVREALDAAIHDENYEEAARLRDEIRRIGAGAGSHESPGGGQAPDGAGDGASDGDGES